MLTLLHLDASPRNDRSHSRRLSAFVVQQWLERHPGDTVPSRDLRVFTPPHVTSTVPTGPMWSLNHLEPHLRTVFGFVGVSDVTFIYAGHDMAGDEQLERAVNEALAHIRKTVRAAAEHSYSKQSGMRLQG